MLFPWGKRPNPWCVLLEQQLCSATAKTCFPDRLHLSGVVFPLSQTLLWPQHPSQLALSPAQLRERREVWTKPLTIVCATG